jgi:hypothetical protein
MVISLRAKGFGRIDSGDSEGWQKGRHESDQAE